LTVVVLTGCNSFACALESLLYLTVGCGETDDKLIASIHSFADGNKDVVKL